MIIVKKIAIGIDIGGTFTDIMIQNKDSGEIIKQYKVSTTPKNPEEAINSFTDRFIDETKEFKLTITNPNYREENGHPKVDIHIKAEKEGEIYVCQ